MQRSRLTLIFGGVAVVAIVAGVITALLIAANRNSDAPSPEYLAGIEAMATKAAGRPGTATAERAAKLGTPIPADSLHAVTLMFCEPLREGDGGTRVAVIGFGQQVVYAPGGCQADVDASGAVAVRNADGSIGRVTPTYVNAQESPADNIVWTPAMGTLNGAQVVMTGRFLKHDAAVGFDSLGAPILTFNMTDDGQQVFGSLSQRLIGYPVATFVDGVPLRGARGQILAPTIQARITTTGQTTGLSLDDAKRLAALIDDGLAQ